MTMQWLDGKCGYIFDWSGIQLRGNQTCAQWKADIAFAFLSALCWLVSALLSVYIVHRERRKAAVATTTHSRRRWGRHSRV